jgi:hypothetical protein
MRIFSVGGGCVFSTGKPPFDTATGNKLAILIDDFISVPKNDAPVGQFETAPALLGRTSEGPLTSGRNAPQQGWDLQGDFFPPA